MELATLGLFIAVSLLWLFSSTVVHLPRVLGIFLLVLCTLPSARDIAGMQTTFVDIAFAFCALVLVLRHLLYVDGHFRTVPGARVLLVLALLNVVVVVLSTMSGNNIVNAVRELYAYARIPLAVFVFANMLDTGDSLETLVKASLVLCLGACLYGLYQYTHAGTLAQYADTNYDIKLRIYSFFGNPNVYGAYLEVMYFVTLSWCHGKFIRKEWLPTAAALGLIALIAANIALTYSRGAFLFTAIVTVLYLWRQGQVRILAVGSLLLICAIGGGALSDTSETLARQVNMFSNPSSVLKEWTMAHRVAMYLNFTGIVIREPLTGIGWGVSELPTFFIDFQPTRQIIHHFGALNSLYFDLAVKSGVISMMLFVAVLLGLLRLGAKVAPRLPSGSMTRAAADGLAFGVLCLLIHSSMDNPIKWPQVGFLISALTAIVLTAERRLRASEVTSPSVTP